MDDKVVTETCDAGITMAAGGETMVDDGLKTAAQVHRIGGNMFGVADCSEILTSDDDGCGADLAATVVGDCGADAMSDGDTDVVTVRDDD